MPFYGIIPRHPSMLSKKPLMEICVVAQDIDLFSMLRRVLQSHPTDAGRPVQMVEQVAVWRRSKMVLGAVARVPLP